MNYIQDFKKWKLKKMGKLAFEMFSKHGLPLEDTIREFDNMKPAERLMFSAKLWGEYCKEKDVPKEYLDENRKEMMDNKDKVIDLVDKTMHTPQVSK